MAVTEPEMTPAATVPAAPTGRYTIRITANDDIKTRDFTISLDPRLTADGITEADLREQFALSLRVRDRVSEAAWI